MSTMEASRGLTQMHEFIDPRICPPEEVINWETNALLPQEVALVNHIHGLVGDHIAGSEEVKVAMGIDTLGRLTAFQSHVAEETKEESARRPDVDGLSFSFAVHGVERMFTKGMFTAISNLHHIGARTEIVPAIVRRFSVELPAPEGVIEDLSAVETDRAILRQAIREGVVSPLRFALETCIDDTLRGLEWDNKAPQVRLEFWESEEELSGQLKRVHHDMDGGHWLDIDGENGRERINQATIKQLGVVVRKEVPVQETPEQEQPLLRRSLFGRRRR